MTKEQIEKEINEIELAMCDADPLFEMSFAYAQAEERLEYLENLLAKLTRK